MKLPTLPKQIKNREAEFGVQFRAYIKKNPWDFTAHFELKQTEGESIPFSSLEDHQIIYGEALRDSAKGVLIRNMGGSGEPDYTYSYRDPVFVVIKYPGEFFIIQLSSFLKEKEDSVRKSLTRERAREIAHTTVTL